ncbi:MFS general substrate transporter [Linderina pennispora]|uniref:MFS general substrate transporter n=1 Tax=Linderina pennispora TaxID=61395 RepID=A0A1Y1W1Y6_9FUNG|nr:MFS general substrate transporter [Linderina pennispora]ORX67559.1 MFS general substrate transporter [Linderina pennispora]
MASISSGQTHTDASEKLSELSKTPKTVSPGESGQLPYAPFTPRMKAVIVSIAAITALVSPLSANMYYPSIQKVRDDLHTTQSGITWTITSYMISMAIFPLVWSNLADQIGRKPVYAVSMFIYTAGSIGCALSNSLSALIISRIVQSAGASAVQGAGAGTISDIYPREQRGTALGIYYLGPLLGPCIGPLIGGYVGQDVGWRWVFWIPGNLGRRDVSISDLCSARDPPPSGVTEAQDPTGQYPPTFKYQVQ